MSLLGRLLGNKEALRAYHAWDGSEGYYIARFRKRLDEISAQLAFTSRFNKELRRAELVNVRGEVVATVRVEGEGCAPTIAIIATNLVLGGKALLEMSLDGLRIESEPLP